MKIVFNLRDKLRANPRLVEKTQALTLDKTKPNVGLRGKHGLFGSKEWWDSIESGKMPLLRLSGVIEEVYAAGQDAVDVNTIDIRTADGSLHSVGIYLNDKNELGLFKVGREASIVYALDELKFQPSPEGGLNVAKVALEMSISCGRGFVPVIGK